MYEIKYDGDMLLVENNQCWPKVNYFHISPCTELNDTKNANHVTIKVQSLPNLKT